MPRVFGSESNVSRKVVKRDTAMSSTAYFEVVAVSMRGLRLTRVRGQIYTPSVVVRGAIPEVSNLLSISRIRSTI